MAERFEPDFDTECRICGTSPCVIVVGHKHMPHTDLCGRHFFDDTAMINWELWNDVESTEDDE